MRSFVLSFLCAALAIGATAPASADPTADMVAMGHAFAAVKSYHADITTSRGTMSMDMIVPDTFHVTMNAGKMQVIKIGDNMWVNMNGQWRQMPAMSGAMVQRPLDVARNAGIEGKVSSDYTITDEGPALVNGVPSHKYHMVNKTDGNAVDVWLSKSLPVQVQVNGKEGTSTIVYSEYNSVPDITPPM
jgi:hypothetical protein